VRGLALALALTSVAVQAQTFEGYDAYYASLPRPVFAQKGSIVLLSQWTNKGELLQLWRGEKDGHDVRLAGLTLKLDGRTLRLDRAVAFPRETPATLSSSATLYLAGEWGCLEGSPQGASGSATRHTFVYLLNLGAKPGVVLLPTLFASCLGVRRDAQGSLLFDEATYVNEPGAELPTGVKFHEFRLDGTKFTDTGREVRARFPELVNVYRFEVVTK
jgi:hypothetical protein